MHYRITTTTVDLMRVKLIKDPANGYRYQWRYYDVESQLWHDYHGPHDSYDDAIRHDMETECTFRLRFAARKIGALGNGDFYVRTIRARVAHDAIINGVYCDLENVSKIVWE